MSPALQAVPARSGCMPFSAVSRLVLRDFRNYRQAELATGPGVVVLDGANGAGKTNLLEAVSLLAPGRGLRRVALPELDRDGAGPFVIDAVVETIDGPLEIVTGRDPASERRYVRLFDQTLRGHAQLGGFFGVSWLVPAMDRLLTDAASSRRGFLDRLALAVQPDHASRVGAYERAMRERSAILRDGRRDEAWLRVLETRMAEPAVAVAAARLEVIAALNVHLQYPLFDLPRVGLSPSGEVEEWLQDMSAIDAEERLCAVLAQSRERDALVGGARHGVHRSDLVVHDLTSGEPAGRISTGRQKAVLLSIILAEAVLRRERSGMSPILLLDEVAAHLDANRRAALCEALSGLGAQVWLTGTDRALFDTLAGRAQFYHVDEGRLSDHE
ncbi:MAG: DNA replication/repair protein RecF [Geminicoccaceae bacterium]|nr:DNA replication/repair protein RecF [Geminicoccaceae bacterium]MCB9944868.1 DNA replication/repair protein RecF [Geminicoccaceae bacterium]